MWKQNHSNNRFPGKPGLPGQGHRCAVAAAAALLLAGGLADGSMTAVCTAQELPVSVSETETEQVMPQEALPVGETWPSMPHMSYEEYPKVDGSLACVPLMEALIMEVTGCTEAQAEESLVDFSNTNPSYEQLTYGAVELILSYEASADTKSRLNDLADLELLPVGKDALVFLVNAGNPVENLTQEQICDIYRGNITQWSEVGGEAAPIKAFQRRENSGSQTLMRLLLMGDEEIPEKQMVRIEGMEGLIDALVEFDNSANAIGYSVYYYASSMYHQDNLKFLAVDGVSPDRDTIRTGSYPLTNPFYVGTGKQSGENAIRLRDWLLSEEGQRFVEAQGYVSAG